MKGTLLKDLNLFPEKVFYNDQLYYYIRKNRDYVVYYPDYPEYNSSITVSKGCFWNLVDQGTIEVL